MLLVAFCKKNVSAKREWKKTHSKLPVAEVAKANKATKKQTQTKKVNKYE